MRELFHILDGSGVTYVLLFFVVFVICFDWIKYRKPRGFPPGPPWSLPLIGDGHRVEFCRLHLQLLKFAEKYGNIFSIRLIGPQVVVLNGYKAVKEAFVDQGENFADRPTFPISADIVEGKSLGLVESNGYVWKQQRRFALFTLKNFGLGRKSLEPSIQQECRCLNEEICDQKGKPFNPQRLIHNAVSNIICVLVFGDRFEYNNGEFQAMLKLISDTIKMENGIWVQLYNLVPGIMRHVPGPHLKMISRWRKVTGFVRNKVEEHREDYQPSSPRDYIDCFLDEMEKWKHDEAAGFDLENLAICTSDLFIAGTETTSTTLYWGLLYMINYPKIQRKVQEEIDRVIGSSRPPALQDRESMPYTNAVIHETQRCGNILPLNLGRVTTKDTKLRDYTIPKGTMVIGSLTSVLFDESVWETPHSFNPAHFLDGQGSFRKRDAFLPFSAGKRVCLGEQLAKMELFLFFTALLQRFSFAPPEGVKPTLEYTVGFTHCPKPYELCAIPR
ncbi:cytochrome P450 2J2-like [Denticeps clupeoides]|uniref:cytochrome P450 2J2-like n=1 Tax=Denticeps clupeoides TaxID=299321 RepID=UPI0010A3556A|nr:cytochrome P450 2J2-like [Denticeps clupeoides]